MRYGWRCYRLSVYSQRDTRLWLPVTALPSARAHDGATCRSATAGGGDAPNLGGLAGRNQEHTFQHTVPMAGIARNGTDNNAPMVVVPRVAY